MTRRYALAALVAGAALVTSSCDTPTREPIVITDPSGVIVDMPAGVRWDVRYGVLAGQDVPAFIAECNGFGGEPVVLPDGVHVCEDTDY